MSKAQTYTLKALTAIWTGDASRRGERLISTGLLGSIRWWFEVVVRGLGGSACDPTRPENRCPDSRKKPTERGHHCVACELFGCTAWARKFRFDVLGSDGMTQQGQIKTEQTFQKTEQTFQLRFTPLRPIVDEEWALLDATIRIIADYGAIGGKTVYKPTEESSRQSEQHHQDFGLVKLVSVPPDSHFKEREVRRYVSLPEWRKLNHGDFGWASLQNFWCVHGRHLSREGPDDSSFNRVLGRHESKKCLDCGEVHDRPQKCPETNKHPRRHSDRDPSGAFGKWLAGTRGESKKVFSFKAPESSKEPENDEESKNGRESKIGRRTFGFVKPGTITFDKMLAQLKGAWPDLKDQECVRGGDILERILDSGAGGSL